MNDKGKIPQGFSAGANVDRKSKTVRKKKSDDLIIVGIGASAGGLDALQKMLPNLPSKKGMAYIIVQHQAPGRKSMLAELLVGHTDLTITIIQNGIEIVSDTIYISPPDRNVSISNNRLIFSDSASFGPKPSIDYFFSSLAEEKGNMAVGIQNIHLGGDGENRIVKLQVGPASDSPDLLFLAVFSKVKECVTQIEQQPSCQTEAGTKNRISELEHELSETREYLQDMVEVLETKSEELQILNEELQSTNEELRASIEELGTSNEELEASNEELNTVNEELRAKSDELVHALHGMEESEKRYRELVQYANSAIIRWRADGSISFFNEYAQHFFGYHLGEIIGKTVDILVPEKDSKGQDLTRLVNDIVANPSRFENCTNENVRRDGKRVWMTWTNKPILNEKGNVEEILAVGNDITVQKKAELTLKESEERLALFIENAPVAIAMFDLEMRYISCSQRWLSDFGIGGRDVIGRSHYELFPELTQNLKDIHQRAMKGEVLSGKCGRFERGDGSVQWLNWEIKPWRDHEGSIGGVLIFSEDITELKQAETDREQLQEKLNQVQKLESIGRLAGGVAHDYNNMLNVILGYAELAMEKEKKKEPICDELMEISKAAQRSAGVTRQLLAFARKQTIMPRGIDLNGSVEGILKMLHRLIGENIELVWHPGRNLWPVKMDPGQVDQILANLCVNARAAILDLGSIKIETSNTVIQEADCNSKVDLEPGEFVKLTVSDDGCGMDSNTLDKIFEPFFTTKNTGEGTGLGLATVYGIVKQNNGFIYVESECGKGTIFHIFFPKYEIVKTDTASQIPDKTVRNGKETILLVEDELAILKVTTRMLEQMGYVVVSSRNPLDALEIAAEYKGRIDLLITDVIMPFMNGRVMAEKIKTLHPGLKCLFMSGYTADIISPHGMLDDGVDFIEKPFRKEELEAKLRDILDKTIA